VPSRTRLTCFSQRRSTRCAERLASPCASSPTRTFPATVVTALRSAGHDVLWVKESMSGATGSRRDRPRRGSQTGTVTASSSVTLSFGPSGAAWCVDSASRFRCLPRRSSFLRSRPRHGRTYAPREATEHPRRRPSDGGDAAVECRIARPGCPG
jgi:hypothetical protein